MALVLLIVCILLIFGALPTWGYHSYGFYPSGAGVVLLVLLLVFLVMGRW